jgi:hypothetical protein
MERRMPVSDYDPIFEEAGREWNVDPALLRSIAHQESGGNRNAKSSAGARGVMQIMPPTGADLGVTDFSDPAQSIFAGAKYMRQMLDQFKEPALAVAAYNAGPQRIADWQAGKGALPKETAAYVPAVSAHYAKFTKSAAPAPAGKDDSGVPSDEDFLKQVAPKSEPKAAPVPNDDDFLKGVGAKPVEPEKPAEMPGMEGMNEPTIGVGPAEDAKPTSAPPTSAAARIGNAMSDAYNNAPNPLMTEDFRHSLEDSGAIGRGASAVLDSAGKLIRFIPAGVAGGMAAVGEGATALGAPSLGRDLNIASQVVPMAHMGTGVPALAGAPKAAPRFVGEHFGELTPADTVAAPLSPEFRANPLAPGAAEKVAAAPQNALTAPSSPVPTMTIRPEPAPVEAAGPKSVGAAASREQTPFNEIALTPKQVEAYRANAEGEKLLEPQQPGIQDKNAYIKGVQPNTAEIEQTVNEARDLKALGQKHKDISQDAQEIASDNNIARQRHFADLAGSKVDVLNAEEAVQHKMTKALDEVWKNKSDVDPAPIHQEVESVLDSSVGKLPPVQDAMNQVSKSLFDRKGNIETDPERLFGSRRVINFLLSKKNIADKPAYGDPDVQRALRGVRDVIDKTMQTGAPGLDKALADYAEGKRGIDRMEVLQDFEPKLYDTQNRMQYAPVQRMMKSIVDARLSGGVNPFKSLTEDDMSRLWALRDDLRRSASAKDLAKAYGGGSDTVPNAIDQAKNLAVGAVKGGAELAAHAGANWVAPVAGSLVVNHVKGIGSHMLSRRQTKKELERGRNMLHPKVELRNPLDYP